MYGSSSPVYTKGAATIEVRSSSSEGILLTTGASDEFVAKNIYDIAGNVSEWTMEGFSATIGSSDLITRISRGGSFDIKFSANARYNTMNCDICSHYMGFRPVLYIGNV